MSAAQGGFMKLPTRIAWKWEDEDPNGQALECTEVAEWAQAVLFEAEKDPAAAAVELRRLIEHLTIETPVPEQPNIPAFAYPRLPPKP
jgi:hypothetical protein